MRRVQGRLAVAAALSLSVVACGSPATNPSTGATPSPAAATLIPTPSTGPVPLASPASGVVGHWTLTRSCESTVAALTRAGLTAFIRTEIEHEELVTGMVNGTLPADFDAAHPCAHAKPPLAHSHTFWPDGLFNSYDETGRQVDEGSYVLGDKQT